MHAGDREYDRTWSCTVFRRSNPGFRSHSKSTAFWRSSSGLDTDRTRSCTVFRRSSQDGVAKARILIALGVAAYSRVFPNSRMSSFNHSTPDYTEALSSHINWYNVCNDAWKIFRLSPDGLSAGQQWSSVPKHCGTELRRRLKEGAGWNGLVPVLRSTVDPSHAVDNTQASEMQVVASFRHSNSLSVLTQRE